MINKLVATLRDASKKYYETGDSPLSDAEYDSAVKVLESLDPENPYLSEIGPTPEDSESKVYHILPMGTLSKYHTDEEIKDFLSKEKADNYLVSPKYDGFGVELIYKDMELVSASTRGNGVVGEDITESVKCIRNIPHTLPTLFGEPKFPLLIIRGEAIIPTEMRGFLKERGYTSLRNAVPGLVRSNSPLTHECVDFVAYNVITTGDSEWYHATSQRQLREYLLGYGFSVEEFYVVDNDETCFTMLKDFYDYFQKKRGIPYEYDGVVIKNGFIQDDDWRTPTHQIAWKFKSSVQVTTMTGIDYQIGATGKISPVAIFEPVEFQGATLTRASLGSMDRLSSLIQKGLGIGCLISVTRQGDIIPYVQDVVVSNTPDAVLTMPKYCFSCGEPLEYIGKNAYCTNPHDKMILKRKISQYISCLKVKGIGQSIINKLVDYDRLNSISSIYTLDTDSVTVRGWGDSLKSKWETLKSMELTDAQIFRFYPMDDVGDSAWTKLFEDFTPEELRKQVQSTSDIDISKCDHLSDSKLENIRKQLEINRNDLCSLFENF